jgi:hypothetical protein
MPFLFADNYAEFEWFMLPLLAFAELYRRFQWGLLRGMYSLAAVAVRLRGHHPFVFCSRVRARGERHRLSENQFHPYLF